MALFVFLTDNLAVGARIKDAADIAKLLAAGVTHVLNVCDLADFDTLTTVARQAGRIAAELSSDADERFPFSYCWNPTKDDGKPKPTTWFQTSLYFGMPVVQSATLKLYVHCSKGYNRGPSTAYAIMRAQGWEKKKALRRIHWRRKITLFGGLRYIPDAERALKELGYP